jgi:hypothetical protein
MCPGSELGVRPRRRSAIRCCIGASQSQKSETVLGCLCAAHGVISEEGQQWNGVVELRVGLQRVQSSHMENPRNWKRRHSGCWKQLCRDGAVWAVAVIGGVGRRRNPLARRSRGFVIAGAARQLAPNARIFVLVMPQVSNNPCP